VILSNSTTNELSALTVVFYTASAAGAFDLLVPAHDHNFSSIDLIQVSGAFTNGQLFSQYINATSATFNRVGKQGVHGVYDGAGENYFTVSSDLSKAYLAFDSPEQGLRGQLTIHSIAPSSGPCGPPTAGADLHITPNIGWIDLIADGNASGEIRFEDHTYHIKGYGYHDKNWGDSLFSKSFNTWYWGHARVGEYSLVWFDIHNEKGPHKTSIYVAKEGKSVLTQCSTGFEIRPIGNNTHYPPQIPDSVPDSYSINVESPHLNLTLTLNVSQVVLAAQEVYYRLIGSISGQANDDGCEIHGAAFIEQFTFLP
jgi:hypothetical protein